MMWQLWHRLFGWQYVHLRFATWQYVKRVHWTPMGEAYAKVHDGMVFLDRPGIYTVTPITRAVETDAPREAA